MKTVNELMTQINKTPELDVFGLFAQLVLQMKNDNVLNQCLREMDSREWMALYKAVIEVEQGL